MGDCMEIGQGMMGRVLAVRLDKGEDLLEGIRMACEEVGIKCGIIYGVGGLSKARVSTGSTNGESKVVEIHSESKEIIDVSSLVGIISMKGNKTHLNVHLTLSRPSGVVVSGRALNGNLVNPSIELVVLEIQKAKLERIIKEGFEILKIHE